MTVEQLQRLLEFVNGAWLICGTALAVVAAIYLVRCWRILPDHHRFFFAMPTGMRVAVSVLGIGAGVAVTRGAIWIWRVRGSAPVEFTAPFQMALLLGAGLGCASFLLAIKEFGAGLGDGPRAGNAAWMLSVLSVVIFIGVSLLLGR